MKAAGTKPLWLKVLVVATITTVAVGAGVGAGAYFAVAGIYFPLFDVFKDTLHYFHSLIQSSKSVEIRDKRVK